MSTIQKKNINRKQKKAIEEAVNKARPNGNGKVPKTAQQSIPFQQMFKDGICRIDDTHYTKTVQFFDINYQLAQNEDKTAIFENYCDFLNYFDSTINVQLSFLNQVADVEEFSKMIELSEQDDEFNDIRCEYSEMLKNQLAKGNNGLVKTKYIITMSLHLQSIDQNKAIKTVKRKITDLDKMKMEEQKKAFRNGYDIDIMPSDINTFGKEAKSLLNDLQSRNERLFMVTILIMNTADTKRKLDNIIFQEQGIAQKYNCQLKRLDYCQEDGIMACVPIGVNEIEIKRGLTTSSTAIFVPFTTQELFQSGEALYYGLNALSNNMILCDRKQLKNPDGLILGTPGSGKSFSAKREIANSFLTTTDDIIICDPEAEYYPLVQHLNGQVIRISPTSTQYVNPLDININYSEDENPLALKADFILSLCELIVGGKNGLEPIEKTIIDRCVRLVYRDFLASPDTAEMPILQDLYELILKQTEPEAQRIATALEMYVTGSLNLFNHRTNVDMNNRLICFDIKELGNQLKKLGMLVVQDCVWNRVTVNRAEHKSTRYYIDEFHLLLKEEQTAAYSCEIWKRFRKWGGIPTGLTQNVKDLLASREIENIFENSDFIYMLSQAGGDRQILAKQLNISPHQLSYVTNSGAGEGLIFYGNVIIPFVDKFPKDTKLYKIMTTKPEEQ